jgi:hypothetical protein
MPSCKGDPAMTRKGVVKDNIVLLEEGSSLPNGATVMVTLEPKRQEKEVTPEEIAHRQELVAQIKAFSQKLAGRNVNLGDLILKEREELEGRA